MAQEQLLKLRKGTANGRENRLWRYSAIGTLVFVSTQVALPSRATTIASLDDAAAQFQLSAGLANLGFDVALGDRVSLGGSYDLVSHERFGRLTYRLGAIEGASLGVTLGVGYNANSYVDPAGLWLEPAAIIALPLGAPDSPFKLRGLFGPRVFAASSGLISGFRPNIEFSWRFLPGQELTIWGGGVAGWRGTFR